MYIHTHRQTYICRDVPRVEYLVCVGRDSLGAGMEGRAEEEYCS